MGYTDCVRFLYSLGNELRSVKFDLRNTRSVLGRLGHPERSCRFVHVAGTNGKGSTSAYIESALRVAGYRTGLYTSPHLTEPTERIRIAGAPVTPEQFSAAFDAVHAAAEELLRGEALETHPTYFETVTAMAFYLFRELRVELAVLEAGLGGRLDATNVAQPELAVITPIDFDHEAFLGRTLPAIAREKAGILKSGAAAVFARQRPEAAATLAGAARARGVEPVWADRQWTVQDLELHAAGARFVASGPLTVRVESPLPGAHQVENAITAIAALHQLGTPQAAIEEGIRATCWPGRLERVRRNPDVYLDGAHNPSGARALADFIQRFFEHRPVWLVFGAMRDKSIEEIAATLFPLAKEVILTAPRQTRALRPETIRDAVPHPRARVAASIADALTLLERETPPADVVFITGSLFTVGEARALLLQ